MSKKSQRSKKITRKSRRSVKSVIPQAFRPTAKKYPRIEKLLNVFRLEKLRHFFEQRRNILAVLIILIIFGLMYLLKDVFIVATVNGQPIYRWTVIRQLEQQGGQQILDSLITEVLMKQAIKKAGLVVDQTAVDAQLNSIEEQVAAQGLTLDQALAQEGLTKEYLINQIELGIAVEQLVATDVVITEEEIDQYITDNQEFFPEDLTGEELRGQVRQQLYSSAVNQATQVWLQELQNQAKILYLKDYGQLGF